MSNYNNTFIGQLAVGIWTNDINSPSNISPTAISGYIISNIGKFDNLTSSCFAQFGFSGNAPILGMSGDGAYNYDIVDVSNPANLICDPEAAVLRSIYLVTYYENLVQSMGGAGLFPNGFNGSLPNQANIPLQMIKEGDSTLQWAGISALMANYVKMVDQKRKELYYQVENYNINSQGSSLPRTRAFQNIWPFNGGFWQGN